MALSLTTTGRASLVGHTYHESNPAVGHDSLVNPTLPFLPAPGIAVASASKLSSAKARLRVAIRRFAKACFSERRMSTSWSQRFLKTLCLVQLVVIAALVVQFGLLIWQNDQRSKRQAQAEQRWEQTRQHWKLADRIDYYEEVSSEREHLQAQLIELLEERVKLLEQRGRDNEHSPSSQRQLSTKPLF